MEIKRYKRLDSYAELMALTAEEVNRFISNNYQVEEDGEMIDVNMDVIAMDELRKFNAGDYDKHEIVFYIIREAPQELYLLDKSFAPKHYICEAVPIGDPFGIGSAIELAKFGHKITREDWDDDEWVVYMSGMSIPPYNTQDSDFKVNDRTAKFIGKETALVTLPYFAKYKNGEWLPGWMPTSIDLLAEDYKVITNTEEE